MRKYKLAIMPCVLLALVAVLAIRTANAERNTTSVNATAATKFTFHGMTIHLPAGWTRGAVITDKTTNQSVGNAGVVDGLPCRQSKFKVDCPGFILFHNPMVDVPSTMYQPNTGWSPGTDQEGCPQDRDHLGQYWANAGQPTVHKNVTVGGETALYNEFLIDCGPYNTSYGSPGHVTRRYTQRVWYIGTGGGDVIVIVDEWQTPGLARVLRDATWNLR